MQDRRGTAAEIVNPGNRRAAARARPAKNRHADITARRLQTIATTRYSAASARGPWSQR